MWVVGGKVLASRVSPSVMPCFWVVFTVFLVVVRHGCGGLVGWQMVLSCRSGSSDRGSGGVLSVSIWLSRVIVWAALSWGVEFGGFWRWLMVFGVENPFSVSVLSIVPVCWWGSWDVGPERRGYVSVGISCSVHFRGFVVTVELNHIVG